MQIGGSSSGAAGGGGLLPSVSAPLPSGADRARTA